jgi:DNA-binding NarL/FixJ family response regulator
MKKADSRAALSIRRNQRTIPPLFRYSSHIAFAMLSKVVEFKARFRSIKVATLPWRNDQTALSWDALRRRQLACDICNLTRRTLLTTSSIRILIAEDNERFQRSFLSTLQNTWDEKYIWVVSDGLEAVRETQRLQPELILLDIGLPTLNGLEAARRIRNLSPASKIIFVTQESSADMVQEALNIGASGYVVKTDAGRELIAAVTAVLRGEQFLGSRFAGHDFTGPSNLRVVAAIACNESPASTPIPIRKSESAHRHEAHFYSGEESFLHGVTQFVGTALQAGCPAIVIATESHREGLLARLQTYGIDMTAAIEQRRYVSVDASHALSAFMFDGMPDLASFFKLMSSLIASAAGAAEGEPVRVAIFGECVSLLWAQGNAEAAIQIERLGNQIAKTHNADILCGYSLSSVQGRMDSQICQRISAEHSAVHSM